MAGLASMQKSRALAPPLPNTSDGWTDQAEGMRRSSASSACRFVRW
jgi:hypothetical protein